MKKIIFTLSILGCLTLTSNAQTHDAEATTPADRRTNTYVFDNLRLGGSGGRLHYNSTSESVFTWNSYVNNLGQYKFWTWQNNAGYMSFTHWNKRFTFGLSQNAGSGAGVDVVWKQVLTFDDVEMVSCVDFNAPRVKVLIHGWCDYVFDPDYKLMSFAELEGFIKTNKHLPDVPSEKELEDEGSIDLGEMQKIHMKKIEELSLYIIQLNKRIEILESKLTNTSNNSSK